MSVLRDHIMSLTGEQLDVVQTARKGVPMVVEALAGTGKTSTLVAVGEALAPAKCQYIAFNKAIVLDTAGKFSRNVIASTMHSLAMRTVGGRYAHRLPGRKGPPRMPGHEIARLLRIEPLWVNTSMGRKLITSRQVAALAGRAIKRYQSSIDEDPLPRHVPMVPYLGATPEEDSAISRDQIRPYVGEFLRPYWTDLLNPSGRLPFTHDAYLKMWALDPKCRIYADVILFDEAQDTDPVMMSIVQRQPAQVIWVGDRHQQIYEWRGARDALSLVDAAVARRKLTQSFRFGPEIAEAANGVLGQFTDDRVRGLPSIRSSLEELDAPRAMLCRTNAMLTLELISRVERGQYVGLVGNAGQDALSFVSAAEHLQQGDRVEHNDLQAFATWGEVLDYVDHDAGGDDLKLWVELIERHGCDALATALRGAVNEADADVTLSTAHRAKGREWPTVKLAPDFVGKSESTEWRLLYVAVTRAKEALDPFDVGDLWKLMI